MRCLRCGLPGAARYHPQSALAIATTILWRVVCFGSWDVSRATYRRAASPSAWKAAYKSFSAHFCKPVSDATFLLTVGVSEGDS